MRQVIPLFQEILSEKFDHFLNIIIKRADSSSSGEGRRQNLKENAFINTLYLADFWASSSLIISGRCGRVVYNTENMFLLLQLLRLCVCNSLGSTGKW